MVSWKKQTSIIVLTILCSGIIPAAAVVTDDAKAVDVSGGEDHTLVLTANKWVWGCGDNQYSQLGIGADNIYTDQATLLRAHGFNNQGKLQDISDVDAGWTHSLALDVNSLVWSWGNNYHGQLGDATDVDKHTPVQVLSGEQDPNSQTSLLMYIERISAGRSGRHSLAVDANGYAYAWGYNKYGQCGNDVNDCNEWTPVRVHRGEQADDPNNPSNWLKYIVDICAGSDQSIAMEKDDASDPNFNGCVYTWGTNMWGDDEYEEAVGIGDGWGLLGNASDVNFSATPVRVLSGEQDVGDPNSFLKHIVAVSAGWNHCMALEKDDPYDPNIYNPAYTGRVFTWGHNGPGWGGGPDAESWEQSLGGRLGNGTYNNSNVPVLVLSGEQDPGDPNSPLEYIIAISAGEGHSMALDADGYVYTWGDNQYGQLGNGRNDPCSAPVRVVAGMQNREDPNSPLSGVVAISAGHWHSLAIDSNGVVWVWGKTKDGRLGLADMAYADPCVCAIPHRIPVVYDYNDGGVGKGFAFSIQDAINDANEGDVLEASWGIYYENVTFGDESITLRSEHPEDAEVVGETVIDARYNKGYGSDPCTGTYYIGAVVDFNEASGSSLAGFTLVDACGVGVICIDLSSAYVSSCIIQENCWDGIYIEGSSVDVRDCEIRSNAADDVNDFCGIYCQSGCDVNVVNCVVADNDGNGVCCHESSVLITNSTIYGNEKSGIDFNSVSAELRSNLIYGNGISGIEIYNCSGNDPNVIVVNNTIVGNSDYGIYSTEANDVNVVNCIVYGNGDDANDNLYAGDSETFDVTYSCIEDTSYGGTGGNITSDPCFVDDVNDDYHLTWNSPCVDWGEPNFVEDANETDIDGNPRIMGGRVDIGADEDFPHCDPNYPDWVLLGRPNCWVTPYQCDGDADCATEGVVTKYRVALNDLNLLIENWKKKAGDETLNPCADIDHKAEGVITQYRVSLNDLNIVIAHWKWTDAQLPGDCVERGCQRGVLGGGSPGSELSSKELLRRLAEIWLDPDVRKAIDEDAWQRLLDSLKKEWDSGI